MARINHRDCLHPATSAGRTACRKQPVERAVARAEIVANATDPSKWADEAAAWDAIILGR